MLLLSFKYVQLCSIVLTSLILSIITALPHLPLTQPFISQSIPQQPPHSKVFLLCVPRTGIPPILLGLSALGYGDGGCETNENDPLFPRESPIYGLSLPSSRTQDTDVFSGALWDQVYAKLAMLYPDSKFILSLGESDHMWLRIIDQRELDSSQSKTNDRVSLEAYHNHPVSIRHFFFESEKSRNGMLLEVVLDQNEATLGEEWRTLRAFLGMNCREFDLKASRGVTQLEAELQKISRSFWGHLRGAFRKCLDWLGWLTALNL